MFEWEAEKGLCDDDDGDKGCRFYQCFLGKVLKVLHSSCLCWDMGKHFSKGAYACL